MKKKTLLYPLAIGISCISVMTLSAFSYSADGCGGNEKNSGGSAADCGSPGEQGTCSRTGCHGAGSGGLADNAGPGGVVMSSVPAMTGNQYSPGQTYAITITVSQTGVTRFGFGCEILDNSGNTDLHVNNTAGTVTVTDAVNTRTWQSYATGRLAMSHTTSGGFSSNTASFNFNWTAPASGTVNVYFCGNATNNNTVADAGDNIYSHHTVLTPLVTGINSAEASVFSVLPYPNPASETLNLHFNLPVASQVKAGLYGLDGKLLKELENRQMDSGNYSQMYSLSGIAKGACFLKVEYGAQRYSKMVLIQ